MCMYNNSVRGSYIIITEARHAFWIWNMRWGREWASCAARGGLTWAWRPRCSRPCYRRCSTTCAFCTCRHARYSCGPRDGSPRHGWRNLSRNTHVRRRLFVKNLKFVKGEKNINNQKKRRSTYSPICICGTWWHWRDRAWRRPCRSENGRDTSYQAPYIGSILSNRLEALIK